MIGKLLAVLVIAGSANVAQADKPRTLRNGRPAAGNCTGKCSGSAKAAMAEQEPLEEEPLELLLARSSPRPALRKGVAHERIGELQRHDAIHRARRR